MHADPSISDEHPKEKDGFEPVNPQVSDIGNPKHTSIELRRLPVDVFVQPLNDSSEDITSLEGLNAQQKNEDQRESRMIRRVFQNSNYTLNTQMMISFGLVNFLTILFVVIICVVVTFRTGEKVKSVQVEAFQSLTESSLSITARYLAESLDRRMMPLDVVDIIYEATQDRFLGGLQESDEYVPFPDAITGDNIYPVIGPDLFLDWQVPRMVNQSNHQEHLQSERWSFYQRKSAVSAASGLFVMQGTCDPGADQGGAFYWENCSDSSNDIALGGSYNPSNLTSIVYRKGKDLVPVLKAIFEAHSQIRDLGLFFKAEGNGASINYPAYALDTMTSYTSLGCDWMTRPNPLDPKRSIGTTNEISRCHPAGQNVSNRVYNPMERGWCQEQALNPAKTFARLDRNVWSPDHIQLFLGRAIYDRLTKDFLACIYVGVSFDGLVDFLEDNRVTPNSHVSIVQFDPLGHVISSSFHHSDRGSRDPVAINELDLGVTTESFRELLSLVDYTEEWNATDAKESYESFVVQEHGFAVYAYPVPPVPSEYDPNYRPEFLVLVSIADDDMLRAVRQVDDNVNETVSQLHVFACALGLIGFIVTSFIIFAMARTLTAPLRDMNSAALEIINSFGSAGTAEDTHNGSGRLVGSTGGLLWSPRTELHEVVAEYNKMVANFSGSLMAKTQRKRRVEIKNPVISRDLLDDLYRSYKSNPNVWSNEDSNASPAASTLENYPCQNDHRIHAAAGPGFKNGGRNTTSGGFSSILVLQNKASPKISRSPLFWWTVMLIVLPLLLFTVSIAAWVMVRIQDEFNNNVDFAKDSYFEIVVEALQLHSNLRAQAVASSSSASVRDLFLFTRYFGWLLFGGLHRADSFTKMYSGADECKMFTNRSECPYFKEQSFCHCSWNDARTIEFGCTDDTSEDPRYRQIPYFFVQSSDALPNGNRTKSSFPAVDFLPNTTAWWHDPLTVPGHEKASNAAGYETLYDRLRVSSAMPLFPALYNYDDKKNSYLSSTITFEADGLFLGFRGCPGFVHLHSFQSTSGNQAFTLRPELCPEGKFGFDPRYVLKCVDLPADKI